MFLYDAMSLWTNITEILENTYIQIAMLTSLNSFWFLIFFTQTGPSKVGSG